MIINRKTKQKLTNKKITKILMTKIKKKMMMTT